MKIAVIGGGIFGCTAAIHLKRIGHDVELFDKADNIMSAASYVNQYRLHKGYHYPRSPETAKECQDGLTSFTTEYGKALIHTGTQYYAIARHGSKVKATDYLEFCRNNDLTYTIQTTPVIDRSTTDVTIKVHEPRIDPHALHLEVIQKLSNIPIHLNTPATPDMRDRFDKIVVAAYAGTNEVAKALNFPKEVFQYELCEKPVLMLPRRFFNVGVVIMDGEFCSLDPFGKTGFHVMGHVKHALHHVRTGEGPDIPKRYRQILNRGIIPNSKETRIPRFLHAGKKFIPILKHAQYMGSMFTVRTVLPNRDDTDERPSLVHEVDDQIIRLFSGKIGCAVSCAQRVASILHKKGETGQAAA